MKLKHNLKKYKQTAESDEEEGTTKVKRSAMLSLTARSQNNTTTVLEDCRHMFLMRSGGNMEDLLKPEKHFDTTQLFGDKNNVLDLLEAERKIIFFSFFSSIFPFSLTFIFQKRNM